MTLNSEHVDELLSGYFEGDLGDDERRAVDAHLRGCLRCTKIVRDVEAIRRDAANLPELTPSRDLWAGIAERIDTPVIDLRPRAPRAPARRTWQFAAAAVLLMAVSSGVTYLVTKPDGERQTADATIVDTNSATVNAPVLPASTPGVVAPRRSSGSGSTVLISTEPMTAEVVYDQEIVRLRKILDERRRDLDPTTVAAVEKSLRAIDAAIADAKTALASDASSVFLNEQLNRALEKKLGVLRRVALMPVGAS